MEKISVIVSCYNEEKALPLFYEEMERVRKQDFEGIVDFEYIFVNDGSKDKTLEIIKNLRKGDDKVRYVSFSRNFGKEAAMLAGLEASKGDYVTLMDADLQDPPAILKQMYDAIKNEGYDSVGTRRVTRNVVNSILSLKEYNRYSKGLFSFVGFDTKWIEYENVERVAGETKWSFWKLFKYALEGITAFSTTPLILSSLIGLIFCLLAFIAIIFIIVRTLINGDPTAGLPSLVCIIVFVSGVQLFSIGIIGQYLSKTYLEVKKRPIYIIKETEQN